MSEAEHLRSYSDTELLEWIDRLSDGGDPPTVKEVNAHPETASSSTYINRFGSYNAAVKRAGYEPNKSCVSKVDEEDCIRAIQQLADDVSDPPTQEDIRECDRDDIPSLSTIVSTFGRYNKAVVAAGFEPNKETEYYTDAELLNQVRSLSDGDVPPTIEDMNDCTQTASASIVQRRFGSWSDACVKAGLDRAAVGHGKTDWSKEDLLSAVESLADGDDPPTSREFSLCDETPDAAVVSDRFGSWNNAIQRAGYEPNKEQFRWTEVEVKAFVRKFSSGGIAPTLSEFDSRDDGPTSKTVKEHLDPYYETVVEMGLEEPDCQSGGDSYTRKELLEWIEMFVAEFGVVPTTSDLRVMGPMPTATTYVRRFGSLNKAIREAGFDPRDTQKCQEE